MIRAVFWDNDGVLVDTEKLYFQATRELLLRAGVELTEPLFKQISLLEGRSAFDLARGKGLAQAEIDLLHEERNARYTELLSAGVRIMDGVKEALGALWGRALMGIVTSSRKVHFAAIHSETGLLPWFDFVLTREDYGLSKPNPEPYLLAVRRSGFAAGECVAIEDSERGLQSALAAGIRCLVVPNDLTRDGDFAGAWRILENCGKVPAEIERIEALND